MWALFSKILSSDLDPVQGVRSSVPQTLKPTLLPTEGKLVGELTSGSLVREEPSCELEGHRARGGLLAFQALTPEAYSTTTDQYDAVSPFEVGCNVSGELIDDIKGRLPVVSPQKAGAHLHHPQGH